jgi:DNA-binding MarR family transcriptional regulator
MSSGSVFLEVDPVEASGLTEGERAKILVFRLLNLVGPALRALMDERLRPDGLTSQQAALMAVVEGLGSPSVSEAAEALRTTHQNVKQLADALQRKELLRIERDDVDGRVRRLAATESARAFWRDRAGGDFPAVLSWLAPLDDAEAESLLPALVRLEAHLSALRASPGAAARRR